MRWALLVVAACGAPPVPPVPPSSASTPLPDDASLGELAIAPASARDDSWIPQGTFPFLVEETLREGPAPRWRAIDSAGGEATLRYGQPARVAYGCDDHELAVRKLEGAGALRPGLVWLRPPALGAATPLPITASPPTPARRGYRIGPVTVELRRQQADRGVVELAWERARLAVPFERAAMEGADTTAPMDLADPGIGQPVPEAAWRFGEAALIVFRVPSYEGLGFRAVVIDRASAREVPSLARYLYQCAF